MKNELEKEYIVEKILEKRKFRNEYKYKVKWLGYPESKSTWEPISHLTKCLDLIEIFEKNHNHNNNITPDNIASNTEDKKLIGKKRRNRSVKDEDIEDDESSLNNKLIKNSAKINSTNDNLLLTNQSNNNFNNIKSSNERNIPYSIKSVTSSSSEQTIKESIIKSPEKLRHIESINNEFKGIQTNLSPKIITRTMLRKSEDDKIIENVFEK